MHPADTLYLSKFYNDTVACCSTCNGTGLNCECGRRYQLEYAKVSAGIPAVHRQADISKITDPQYRRQCAAVADYVDNLLQHTYTGVGAYMYGGTGTAKTYLACYILIKAIEKGLGPVKFTTRAELSDVVHPGQGATSLDSYLSTITTYRLLALDNVSFYYKADRVGLSFSDYVFQRVIHARASAGLPTIFTSRTAPSVFAADCEARDIPFPSMNSGTMSVIAFDGTPYTERKHAPKKIGDKPHKNR